MLDKPYIFILIGFFLVGLVYFFEFKSEKNVWHPSEKEAIAALIEIYQANWKWKSADPDGNSELDFWAKDIAGLYYYPDSKTGKRIKFISFEIASADSRMYPSYYQSAEMSKTPLNGYFFRMMKLGELGYFLAVDDPSTKKKYRNLTNFCVVAYPVLNKRLRTFIINEKKELYYKQSVVGEDIDQWPRDPSSHGWVLLK